MCYHILVITADELIQTYLEAPAAGRQESVLIMDFKGDHPMFCYHHHIPIILEVIIIPIYSEAPVARQGAGLVGYYSPVPAPADHQAESVLIMDIEVEARHLMVRHHRFPKTEVIQAYP